MGSLHGQRVFGVIHSAMVDFQRIAQIGHPLDGAVQGALEQIAVDFLLPAAQYPQRDLGFQRKRIAV